MLSCKFPSTVLSLAVWLSCVSDREHVGSVLLMLCSFTNQVLTQLDVLRKATACKYDVYLSLAKEIDE